MISAGAAAAAHVAGHALALLGPARAASADRVGGDAAGRAMLSLGAVAGGHAAEVVPLHHAGVALALGREDMHQCRLLAGVPRLGKHPFQLRYIMAVNRADIGESQLLPYQGRHDHALDTLPHLLAQRPVDQVKGTVKTITPTGKTLELKMRNVDVSNSERLAQMENITVLKSPEEIYDVIGMKRE